MPNLNYQNWYIWLRLKHKQSFDLLFLVLKVSKSQKHFFLKLRCPKNEGNTVKLGFKELFGQHKKVS